MVLSNLKIVGSSEETKDIKIENGLISEINTSGSLKDEVVINFENCIAFPGLINSHDHLEFNLYPKLGNKVYRDYVEWGNELHSNDKEIINSIESIPVELRMKYGILKNLLNGVTAVAHHGAYHSCFEDSPVSVIRNGTCIHSVRLGGKWKLKLNWIKNIEPYVIHIGEGLNTESSEEINELVRWNLLKRKIIGIHGIAMSNEQAKNFEALIWCPVSNQFLFGKTADIKSLKKNTKILFGTDSTLTAEWNIWDHLRKARQLNLLDDSELFASVTKTPAHVWGFKKTGEISEEKIADIVIARKKSDNLFESFYGTDPEDILLIFKNGKIILYDEVVKEMLSLHMEVTNHFQKIEFKGIRKFIKYNANKIFSDISRLSQDLKF